MADPMIINGQQIAPNALDPAFLASLQERYPQQQSMVPQPDLGYTPAPTALPIDTTIIPQNGGYPPGQIPDEPALNAAPPMPSREQAQPGVQVIPTTQRTMTVSGGVDIPKPMLNKINKAADEVIKYNKEAAIAEIEAKKQEANMREQAAIRIQDEAAVEQTIRENETARIEQSQQQVRKLREDYASQKIDSNRMFRDKPLNTILGAIAIAAGQYAAIMTGTKNTALDIINQAIDRDIDEQRAEVSKKGQVYEMAQQEHQILRQSFADEGTQRQAQRVMRLDAANQMMQAAIDKSAIPTVKAKLMTTQAMLQKQMADEEAKLYMSAAARTQMSQTDAMQIVKGVSEDKRLQTAYGNASNIEAANEVNKAVAGREYLKAEFKNAREAIKKYGTAEILSSEGRAALQSAKLSGVQALQKAFQSGVLGSTEFKNYSEQLSIGGLEGAFTRPGYTLSLLDEIEQKTENILMGVVRANIPAQYQQKQYQPTSFKPR
jgi:hypothetical protein